MRESRAGRASVSSGFMSRAVSMLYWCAIVHMDVGHRTDAIARARSEHSSTAEAAWRTLVSSSASVHNFKWLWLPYAWSASKSPAVGHTSGTVAHPVVQQPWTADGVGAVHGAKGRLLRRVTNEKSMSDSYIKRVVAATPGQESACH